MTQRPIVIGSREYVDLPELDLQTVPAKVDTGADSSAIWASDIHSEGDVLTYRLFAPGSALYSGQEIRTKVFKTAFVKNSFGHTEFRYKVRLLFQVGETRLRRWVTLADRSRNTYPILLGKSFLKNRFVVDVSRSNLYKPEMAARQRSVLLLSAKPQLLEGFVRDVSQYNQSPANYSCVGYDQLTYYLDDAQTAVTNAADGSRDLADYDLIYFKSHNNNMELAVAAAEYLHFRHRRFIDDELQTYVSTSKLSESLKLTCHGLPVPPTFCAQTPLLRERYNEIEATLGKPFVLKEIFSDKGRNNYLIRTKQDFYRVLDEAPTAYIFAAQKYIENDGFLRVLVVGQDVGLVIRRSPTRHADRLKAHLNKPAGSKNAEKMALSECPNEVQELAVKAAVTLKRQVAGVDMVQDKQTKRWYILEVNNAPQIRSGSHLAEKAEAMARYFDKELDR